MASPGWIDAASWIVMATAWVAYLLLGNARWSVGRGDRVDDGGTLVWGLAIAVGSLAVAIVAAMALPWATVAGQRWIARLLGGLVALAGVGFREWAVVTLGRFFTQALMVRPDHRVVTSGPYRILRHPGYAGTLVSLIGLGLTLGNWISLAVLVTGFFVAHVPRIRREERLLEESLGRPYRDFERTRKRLIPGLW